MKLINFRNANAAKMRKSLRPRPRPHDPMLVLNMSIFNSERGWERILNAIPRTEMSGHERRIIFAHRSQAFMPPRHDEARKRVFPHFLALHEA